MRVPCLAFAFVTLASGQVASAQDLAGTVNGGGGPIAQSSVTLWAAGEGAPAKLAETRTGDDGAFRLQVGTQTTDGVLYLTARGGEPKAGGSPGANPAIALMAMVGTSALREVTINEL